MSRILCFGAGEHFVNNQNILLNQEDEIVAIADNNEKKWGEELKGIQIISPQEICNLYYDYIVITSIYEKEIRSQLNELGISEKKIFSLTEYKSKLFILDQYRRKYLKRRKESKADFEGKKIVYTAIMGDYDNLSDPAVVSKETDYVCFTNNRKLKSNVWNIEYVSSKKLDNMHFAKYYKFFPNKFFQEYSVSVWVDGTLQIIGDIDKYINTYARLSPILCFPHSARNCIYEEAAECIVIHKGNKEDILRQISAYYNEKYPVNNGLYEMGCIVRKHNDEQVIDLMTKWWHQVNEFSYRDQISFPYVCWKNTFEPDISKENIYKNSFLRYLPHNENK